MYCRMYCRTESADAVTNAVTGAATDTVTDTVPPRHAGPDRAGPHHGGTARAAALAAGVILALAGCSHATSPGGTSNTGATQSTTAASMTSGTSSVETPVSTPEQPSTSTPPPTSTPSTSPSQSTLSSSTAATSSTSATAEGPIQTKVYYVIEHRNDLRLAREIRGVPTGAAGPVAAVRDMISGAEDPDFHTTWNPATRVLGVDVTGSLITVNLSADARTANVGSGGAALMVQQLVWTATEAAGRPDGRVSLLIDGAPAGELWGVLSWDRPVARKAAIDVLAVVLVDPPRENASVTSPVAVSGIAAEFEANVPWRVINPAGAVVAHGHSSTSEGMTFAPYSFTIPLPPGKYTVEVLQDDPSDGAAGPPYAVTRTITVSK